MFQANRLCLAAALFLLLGAELPVGAQSSAPIESVLVKDWRNDVTRNDLGSGSLSGNVGIANKDGLDYARTTLECADGSCGLRFAWNFGISADRAAFAGYFLSLAGLTSTRSTFDGRTIETVSFPNHALDLDNVLGPIGPADGQRRAESADLNLVYDGPRPLTLRLELQDASGASRFTRLRLAGSPQPQLVSWAFRQTGTAVTPGFDVARAKVLSLIVERENQADAVVNPDEGTLLLRRVSFALDRAVREPLSDDDLLEETARYAAQYFATWHARTQGSCVGRGPDGREVRHEPGAYGFAQDRSTLGDLLTTGGTGFALAGYAIAAERGYRPRAEAVALTVSVLRVLANPAGFGPEPGGRLGYRGFFYHFLGCDGRRKRNFDAPETPGENEALNTVELSTIDTALLIAGALVVQQYFNGSSPEEQEIRRLAQDLYDRVEWPFMLNSGLRQFALGWKPIEPRSWPEFALADRDGRGHYSGTSTRPAVLDYFTDEALIVILLAAGSRTAPVDMPSELYCALIREPDQAGLVRSWPGSLFTYFFLHAFADTRSTLFPACTGEARPIDWFANTRQAFSTAIAVAERNQGGFTTYGPNAWGFSAAEGYDDNYRAYALPSLAVANPPDEDGTATYYGMVSAVSFGADLRARVVSVLRRAWARGHWHPIYGLPDAFNDAICQNVASSTVRCDDHLLRSGGAWMQPATFAIDQGPMLLHLENARSGLVWRLFGENVNVRRAVGRLTAPPPPPAPAQIDLEAEAGSGDGQIMQRSNAFGGRTVWLHERETRVLAVALLSAARYKVSVRYSNDNFGPLERVELTVDGRSAGSFNADDTGDAGRGWNELRWAEAIATIDLERGSHRIEITPSGGDGFGVEVDLARLTRQ